MSVNEDDVSEEQTARGRGSRWFVALKLIAVMLVAVIVGGWCFERRLQTVTVAGTTSVQKIRDGSHATDGGWHPEAGNYVFLTDVRDGGRPLAHQLRSDHWEPMNVDHAFGDWQSRPAWFGKSRLLTDVNGRSIVYSGHSGGMFLREANGDVKPLSFGLLDKVPQMSQNPRQKLIDVVWIDDQLSLLVRESSNNGPAGQRLMSSLRHLRFDVPSDHGVEGSMDLTPILDQTVPNPAFHGRLSRDGARIEFHQTTPTVLPSPGPPRFVSRDRRQDLLGSSPATADRSRRSC